LQSNEAIKQAILAGGGIGVVSPLAVTLEAQHGLLSIVPLANLHLGRQLNVITHRNARLPAAARAFLSVLYQQHPSLVEQGFAEP
jgi:DNA-binding transcriptional LysR family regulator